MSVRVPHPRPAGAEADPVLAELEQHARTTRDDRRVFKVALSAAVAFHVALLAVRLPADNAPPPPERPTVVPPQVIDVFLRDDESQPPVARPTPAVSPDIPIHVPVPVVFSREVTELPQTTVAVEELEGVVVPPPSPTQPPQQEQGPIRVSSGRVRPPTKIVDVRPVYPEAAHRASLSGIVILNAIIDREGRVRDVQVMRPGLLGMTEAAVTAVGQWRYEPIRLNGRPVEVVVTVTVTFQIARP